MMHNDKEPDNGINIKFGPDKGKKGEYRLVHQNSTGGGNLNGKKNGTSNNKGDRKTRMCGPAGPSTNPRLCSTCNSRGITPRAILVHRFAEGVKGLFRIVIYAATSVLIAYLGWMLYEESFDCFWATAQSLVYTFIALLASAASLLSVCKKSEFTISSKMLY